MILFKVTPLGLFTILFSLTLSPFAWGLPAPGKKILIAPVGHDQAKSPSSLVALTLAHGLNIDYVAIKVGVTSDGQAVIVSDLFLEKFTDVKARFPQKSQAKGNFPIWNFTWSEVEQLKVVGRSTAKLPEVHFPHPPLLRQGLALLLRLNAAHKKKVGFYLILSQSQAHPSSKSRDLGAILDTLHQLQLNHSAAPLFLASYDVQALKEIKKVFLSPLPTIQLLKSPLHRYQNSLAFAHLAQYAVGIGVEAVEALPPLYSGRKAFQLARRYGLYIHALHTQGHSNFNSQEVKEQLLTKMGLDGLITHWPQVH